VLDDQRINPVLIPKSGSKDPIKSGYNSGSRNNDFLLSDPVKRCYLPTNLKRKLTLNTFGVLSALRIQLNLFLTFYEYAEINMKEIFTFNSTIADDFKWTVFQIK
jgi:hypothetical protein